MEDFNEAFLFSSNKKERIELIIAEVWGKDKHQIPHGAEQWRL